MRILSFDQSTRTTGYAVFENNKLIAHNKFTCLDEDMGDRLVKIRKMLLGLIDIYQPDLVAFGVFYETLTEIKMDLDIVPSSVWKSKLGIKGRARADQKRAAAQYVLDTYGVKPTQDECDAICIGAYLSQKPQQKPFDWSI